MGWERRVLQGKTVLVTGAASGLGRAIAVYAGHNGATVALSDINLPEAEDVARLIHDDGGDAEVYCVDVTNDREVEEFVRVVALRHGGIDYLFNNAGYAQNGEFQDISPAGFRYVFDVDFWGVVYGTRAAYPIMIKQGYGTIANIISLAGLIPGGLMTAYGAAKHAANGFTLNLRSEAKLYGVNVVAVCPGYLETPMHANAENVTEYVRNHDAEYLSRKHPFPSAERVVGHLMRGVLRNKAIVVSPPTQKVFWWLFRLVPGLIPAAWASIIRRIKVKEERKGARV